MFPSRVQRGLRVIWPFVALCLMVSSRWVLEGAHPEAVSTAATEALGCFSAGCLVAGWAWWRSIRGRPLRSRTVPEINLSLAAGLLVSGPALASLIADRHLSGENATLALSLTPVVVAVASQHFYAETQENLTARLWPGLAGMAGLLLLLAQPKFSSWRFTAALAAMPLIAGVAAAFVRSRLHSLETSPLVTLPDDQRWLVPWPTAALIAAALVFGVLALRASGFQREFSCSPLAASLDGITASLSLLVLARAGAVRWSAQFLAIPLFTLLEGVFLLRPILDTRSWLAFTLLLVSTGYLLWVGE